MSGKDIAKVLGELREASGPKAADGSRIHLHYTSMSGSRLSPVAVQDAQRAKELGLPQDRYTGRVNRIFTSAVGDRILNMLVELERDRKFRSFNLSRGQVHNIIVLGD